MLVADGHDLVRQGLRALIEARPGWQVCGEASDPAEMVGLAERLRPDVAVLDAGPQAAAGLAVARQLLHAEGPPEVVVLSTEESEQLVRQALAAGARAVVLRSDPGPLLVAAIEAAGRHESFFSPRISALIVEGYMRPPAAAGERPGSFNLTPRERQIVQLVAGGGTSKEVAARLGLSVKTVEAHRANVMRKLGLHSVADLVRYAVRHRLVDL